MARTLNCIQHRYLRALRCQISDRRAKTRHHPDIKLFQYAIDGAPDGNCNSNPALRPRMDWAQFPANTTNELFAPRRGAGELDHRFIPLFLATKAKARNRGLFSSCLSALTAYLAAASSFLAFLDFLVFLVAFFMSALGASAAGAAGVAAGAAAAAGAGFAGAAGAEACAYAPTANRPAIRVARILLIFFAFQSVLVDSETGGPSTTAPARRWLTVPRKIFSRAAVFVSLRAPCARRAASGRAETGCNR